MMFVVLIIAVFLLVAGGALWWLRRPQTPEMLSMESVPTPEIPQATRPAVSSEGMMKVLFADSAHNAMYDLVLETGELHWNDVFYTMFGYSHKEVDANAIEWWASHIHPEDAMLVNDAMDKLLDSTITEWVVSYRFQKADGTYVLVSDRTLVQRGTSGNPIRVFGTLTVQDKPGALQVPGAPQPR